MKNVVKKILSLLLVILIVLPMQIHEVNAVSTNETYYLERGERGFYSVQKLNDEGNWIYITYEIVHYIDEKGNKQIAYCMNPELPGVGWARGSVEGYEVDLNSILADNNIWRACVNGYPYKTPEQMGVETEEDAYLATKQAINCLVRGYKTEEVYTYFRPGETSIYDEDLDEIQRRGKKVVDAIYKLVKYAYTSNDTPQNSNCISVTKIKNMLENDKTYSIEYSVNSKISIKEYEITKIEGLPLGAIITDIKGNIKTKFNANEHFYIKIPKEQLKNDINLKIEINVNAKNYPIFYGESKTPGYQNYAVCCDSYGELIKNINFNLKTNNAKIIINKTDIDTNKPIEGVEFSIIGENGKILQSKKTNNQGIVEFKDLYQGKYKIKEMSTLENYKLDNNEYSVDLQFDETKNISITNEKRKGKIKIVKVDKDNNQVKLQGVKFDILDEKDNVIQTLTTDKNGEAFSSSLPIDSKYKVIEKETRNEYVLDEKQEIIELKENEIKTIKFENEKKKGIIKIIKEDDENEKIKLANVEFDILNSKGEIIEKIKTDEKGEAYSSKLPIDEEYTIKETKTNRKYLLEENPIKIKIEENNIKEVVIKNTIKKGQIQILKTSNDYNEILNKPAGSPIENVVFEIIDEQGKTVDKVKTDSTGIAISRKLQYGTYKIKEIEAGEGYILNEKEYKGDITENEKIVKIEITNNSKKVQRPVVLPKTGF